MDKATRDAMLIATLRKKQELKQQYLRNDDTPLHKESEKLSALREFAAEAAGSRAFLSIILKEEKYLDSLAEEMRASLDSMPEAMRQSAIGQQTKASLMMTEAAAHRLGQIPQAEQSQIPVLLEEAAFLLEGADGRA